MGAVLQSTVRRFASALSLLLVLLAATHVVPASAQSSAAPRIVNPSEELLDFDPRGILRWTSVVGADTYEVVVFEDVELKNQIESSKGQRIT